MRSYRKTERCRVTLKEGKDFEDIVARWFNGDRSMPFKLSQDRSVKIDLGNGQSLKIKGCGYRGEQVQFDVQRSTGPKAPIFDFDGRFVHDIASSHDSAPNGGMSFQQASTERSVYVKLLRLEPTWKLVPCVGWGCAESESGTSWFSLHLWPNDYIRMRELPGLTLERAGDLDLELAKKFICLMVNDGLCGYMSTAFKTDEEDPIHFDLHPFRACDPITISGLSFVMHLIFNVHILGLNLLLQLPKLLKGSPSAAAVRPFAAILPSVTFEDYQNLRWTVIARYAVGCPNDFSSSALLTALKSTRIGSSALELVPPVFALP